MDKRTRKYKEARLAAGRFSDGNTYRYTTYKRGFPRTIFNFTDGILTLEVGDTGIRINRFRIVCEETIDLPFGYAENIPFAGLCDRVIKEQTKKL